METPIPRT